MKAFSEVEGKRLKWTQTGPRAFELRTGQDVVAALEWPHLNAAHAQGRIAEAAWDFRRLSLFGPYIRMATLATGVEVAHFGRGSLEEACAVKFHDGHTYWWRPLVTVEGMSFETLDNKPVVDFRPRLVDERHEANISVYKLNAHVPVLLLLGWYVLEMEYREDISMPSGEASVQP